MAPGLTGTTVTPTASEGAAVRFLDAHREELADVDTEFIGYQIDLNPGNNVLIVEAAGMGRITTNYTFNIYRDPGATEITGISIISSPLRDAVYGAGETITYAVEFDVPIRVDLRRGRPN